mgnify:CR=1 FL=1|jgi:hypothetical protein
MTRKTFNQFFDILNCTEWESFINESLNLNISFYPAAGNDYRPFLYFHEEYVNRKLQESQLNAEYKVDDYFAPDLFIFSDYDNSESNPFKSGEILYHDDNTSIKIINSCEIRQKGGPPHFNPNYVHYLASKTNHGRAFYFKAKITSNRIRKGETISYEKHAIYFIYEDICLIDKFFLANEIPITHLVWNNEGLNMGLGKINHEFLLPLSQMFNTKFYYIEARHESSESIPINNDLQIFSFPEIIKYQQAKLSKSELHKKFEVGWNIDSKEANGNRLHFYTKARAND